VTSDDFDYDAHERLRQRTANKIDSILWTEKAHFKAADWYATWGRRMDWFITFAAGALTAGLLWETTPQLLLIGIAIFTAVLSGYKTAAKPQKKAEDHYKAANAYLKLRDDFRDFVKLELADESVGLDQMQETFEQLSQRRQNLNDDMPSMSSRWYDELDDSIYDEIETTDEAQERLAGCANLQKHPDEDEQ
jgi:hypothetical protein